MGYETIIFEKQDGVAKITLNRPKTLNALEDKMIAELAQVTKELAQDDVKVVVLTGSGKAFCAGGDLNRFLKGFTLISGVDYVKEIHPWVQDWINLNKPTIAAVNGYAAGAGLSVMLMCDIAIATENAKFSSAFVNMGLIPDLAATYYLPRVVGVQRAKELLYTGRQIESEEAYAMGMVSRVVPADSLDETVMEMAKKLAKGASFAIRGTKKMVNMGLDMDLNALLELEAYMQGMCFATEDSKEAVNAFLAKRKPIFQGK